MYQNVTDDTVTGKDAQSCSIKCGLTVAKAAACIFKAIKTGDPGSTVLLNTTPVIGLSYG